MPDRCNDCSAPLPQSWTGPLRHCPGCGSVISQPKPKPAVTVTDVKVKKTTTKKKAATSKGKKK